MFGTCMPEGDLCGFNWRKASHSISNGACVEVAGTAKAVAIRDSKNPEGEVLRYSFNAWRSFITAAKSGRFDV